MAPVKGRRRLAADETRRAVIAAAATAFAEDGYAGTTIQRIARDAGVAVQTVYNAVGGKAELLSRVLDTAAAGERAPTPVATFMREQAEAEADPRRILDGLVEFWVGGLVRTAPVFAVIRQAAALDPDVAELERRRAAQRLRNYGLAAEMLAARGVLREGLTVDEAAAVMFAIGHPDAYRGLVIDEGWPVERWASWARGALAGALLRPDA